MWRSLRWAAAAIWAAVVGLVLLTAGPAWAAPELRLEPASGEPGDTFTVIGTGFEAGDVELRWDSERGPLLGTATEPEFALDVTVPADAAPNSHPVVAVMRDGTSLSTSNASFQVMPGPQPVERDPQPSTTTTVADPAVPTAPTGRGSFDPDDARPTISGPARGALGVTGGVGGDASEPVLGTTAGQPAAGAAQNPQAAGATAAPGEATTTTTTGVPAPGGPPTSAVTPAESNPTGTAGTGQDAREASGAALGDTTANQSSEGVRSPALLVVGLAMVLGGAAFLAVRSRNRGEEIDERQ